MRIDYSIVFVSNMSRAVDFYRDVVGLPLKFETPEWTEFDTEGATLALHRGDPGSAGDANAPGTCRTGFTVPDIDAATEFFARLLGARPLYDLGPYRIDAGDWIVHQITGRFTEQEAQDLAKAIQSGAASGVSGKP